MNHLWLLTFTSAWLCSIAFNPLARAEGDSSQAAGRSVPAFIQTGAGEFSFNTGILQGALHARGRSLGLTSVIHIPTGQRLDSSNGLLSHYRVFTKGTRFGGGAWDWPSQARLTPGGDVEVHWPSAPERPFQLRAVYRWKSPNLLELETVVEAEKDLTGFESFVASYFTETFTNSAVCVASRESQLGADFLPVRRQFGDWQMFPKNAAVIPLIQDGRWKLQPNPVNWTIRPPLAYPICYRRSPVTGVTAALMASRDSCFAVASPHETEGHYSSYLSLFGQDLVSGSHISARCWLLVGADLSDRQILEAFRGVGQ